MCEKSHEKSHEFKVDYKELLRKWGKWVDDLKNGKLK